MVRRRQAPCPTARATSLLLPVAAGGFFPPPPPPTPPVPPVLPFTSGTKIPQKQRLRGNAMRLLLAAFVAAFSITSALTTAQAAELTVLSPGFVKFAGIDDLAAAYTKETGIKVTVKSTGMGAMMN